MPKHFGSLSIEPSERNAPKKAGRHAEEQEHLLRRLVGGHIELSDDSDDGSSCDNDDDDPRAADAYTEGQSSTADRKGKGRRGNGDFLLLSR